MNIGFCWAGSPSHHRDYRRSTTLELWRPLWDIPGTTWWSLQVGPRAGELSAHPPHVHRAPAFGDFEETTQHLVAHGVRLVITVDTAILHLAGALRLPVWALLAFPPDWRWGLEGDTTPWYPTARLFRQDREGGWPPVFQRVARCLRAWVAPTTDDAVDWNPPREEDPLVGPSLPNASGSAPRARPD